jgi:predicted ATPase
VTRGSVFVKRISLKRESVSSFEEYPFHVPAVRGLHDLELTAPVTFFVGENGSGKSTLLEAIAVASGFNAEGGTRNFRFATRATHSELHQYLRLTRSPGRHTDGYFLRAESFYNVASAAEAYGVSSGSMAAVGRPMSSRMVSHSSPWSCTGCVAMVYTCSTSPRRRSRRPASSACSSRCSSW